MIDNSCRKSCRSTIEEYRKRQYRRQMACRAVFFVFQEVSTVTLLFLMDESLQEEYDSAYTIQHRFLIFSKES